MRKTVLPIALLLLMNLGVTASEYTFSCWLNGWRKNANDQSADVFGIETSRYGFSLDLADFRKVRFGPLSNPAGYEQALKHKGDKLRQLPPAELLIEVELAGVSYRAIACKAGTETGLKHLSHARLWESGRYVQHYDFLGLDLRNAAGEQLPCDATLDLVAWPGSLTLNLDASSNSSLRTAVLRLAMTSPLGAWQEEQKIKSWLPGQKKSISLTCPVASLERLPEAALSVSGTGDQRFPIRFDGTRNCYVASVEHLSRDWPTGYTDIRQYDDFKIRVKGSGAQTAVPFLLDLKSPANITGLCPVLCDEDGRPTGIPVQLSKNWHYEPLGSYLRAYAMLPAQEDATYLLRVVYGFYGTLPSASHAQLSLIGYGGHGRWDQLAIGCWGETICFDMDMSLVDVAITDIRALMVRAGIDGRKWSWTDAGWGGDWLNIRDESQEKFFWTELKTAYLSQGPCLTQVKYRGNYGMNREVDFSAQTQTLRTDDYCRTFQKLSYTFAQNVSAKKIWLYKLGRTHNYHTPTIAYGNGEGLIQRRDVSGAVQDGDILLHDVEWTGPDPYWFAFPGAGETANRRAKPNGYRGLIIRRYEAVIGGTAYRTPTLSVPVYQARPANLDLELHPPAGISEFSAGDRIEMDVELITLPRTADDYYGPNQSFREHLAENPNSWKTTYREAKGNDLRLAVSGGQVLQSYPIIVQAEEPEVRVRILGGVGAVPLRFQGLKNAKGYQLFRVAEDKRTRLDQSVHGNDFWQTDYDAATATYAVTFNLPLDGCNQSEWLFTRR